MNSISTLILSGVTHTARLLYLLCAMKLIALTLGVEGVGYYSNYMSLLSIAASLAGGGIITGVIKYVSDTTLSRKRKKIVILNAFIYGGLFSLFVAILGLLFLRELTLVVFHNYLFAKYMIAYLIGFFIYGIVNISCSILNGYKKTLKYSLIVSVSHIFSFVMLGGYYYLKIIPDTWGVLIIFSCPVLLQFLLLMLGKEKIIEWKYWPLSRKFFYLDLLRFSKYSLMLIVSTVCFPVVEIMIRGEILSFGTIADVGRWQGVTRLSAAGLSFFSLFLSIYLIPKFSGERNKENIIKSIFDTVKIITLIYCLVGIIIFCFSSKILTLVYSQDFIISSKYLGWQFLGDYFRVLGWIIGFYIVSNAFVIPYVMGEFLQGGGFLLFSAIFLLYSPGLESIFYAYFLTSFSYMVILYTLFYLKIIKKDCK